MTAGQLALAIRNLLPFLRPKLEVQAEQLIKIFELADREPAETAIKSHLIPNGPVARGARCTDFASLLSALASTMEVLEADKQARAIHTVVSALDKISSDDKSVVAATPTTRRAKSAKNTPNEPLARQLADDLERNKTDPAAFDELLAKLSNRKIVDTPTLHRVAQIFLETDKPFKQRKEPLAAVQRRHHDELRYQYQDRVLDRLE